MVSMVETTLASITERLQPQVDTALSRYVDLPAGCPGRLREAMAYSLLAPGKRVRPILVILAAETCGVSLQKALPAACAVEMVHAYSLVHDDLPAMDDDDLRRGRATCHKKFGETLAILAGDALLTLAFEVLAKGVQPPERAAACCAELAIAAGPCHLVGGQADDVTGNPDCGSVDVLESIHRRKTGAMIRVSLRIGAILAEAEPAQLDALDRYAQCLGLAFQIADDLLDVRGSEENLGKRVGKDLQCGRLTFPGLVGIEKSRRRAEQLVDDACRALAPLGPAIDDLEAVARYVLKRNR